MGFTPSKLECLLRHGCLVGGENMKLLGWDDGVSIAELRHHSTDRFDTKSQLGYLEDQVNRRLKDLITIVAEGL